MSNTKINPNDYIRPEKGLLSFAFGNAHRMESKMKPDDNYYVMNHPDLSQLIALERKDGAWDVLQKRLSKIGIYDPFVSTYYVSMVAQKVAKDDAFSHITAFNLEAQASEKIARDRKAQADLKKRALKL